MHSPIIPKLWTITHKYHENVLAVHGGFLQDTEHMQQKGPNYLLFDEHASGFAGWFPVRLVNLECERLVGS